MWRKPVSKFKNAQGEQQPAARVARFSQLGLPASSDEGPEFVACGHGRVLATCGGRLCVWPLVGDQTALPFVASGVSGQLLDLQVSPFLPSETGGDKPLAAAVTADGLLSVLSLSPSPSPASNEAVQSALLDGIDAGFRGVQFSPSVGRLLAAYGDRRLSFIDLEVGASILDVDVALDGDIQSAAWLPDSSRLAVSSGSQLKLLDPRSPGDLLEWRAPVSVLAAGQASRVSICSRSGGGGGGALIALSGLDSARERRLCVWDAKVERGLLATEALGRGGRRSGPARLLSDVSTGMLF